VRPSAMAVRALSLIALSTASAPELAKKLLPIVIGDSAAKSLASARATSLVRCVHRDVERQLFHLAGGCLDQTRLGIAQVDAHDPRRRVQVLVTPLSQTVTPSPLTMT
jgi:hypothetical protein